MDSVVGPFAHIVGDRAQGLEFDLVVMVNPEAFGMDFEGAVDRCVAMTRATGQLAILTDP